MVTGKGELNVIALLLPSTPLSTLHQGACGLTSSPSCALWTHHIVLGVVSRKSRKRFGPAQQFVKLQPAYSVRLFSSYVVKEIKIKITAKYRGSRRLLFEDTKRILSPRNAPEKFRDCREMGPRAVTFYLNCRSHWGSHTRHSSLKFFAFLKILSSDGLQTSKIILEYYALVKDGYKESLIFHKGRDRKSQVRKQTSHFTFSCASFRATSFCWGPFATNKNTFSAEMAHRLVAFYNQSFILVGEDN